MTSLDTLSAGLPGEASLLQQRLGKAARRLAWTAGKVVGLVVATGVVLEVAFTMVPAQDPIPTGATAVSDAWVDVNRPIQLFALVGTEFSKLPLAYSAQRRASGGRRDLLAFGAMEGDTPSLELSFDRIGPDLAPAQTFVGDLERIDPTTRLSLSGVGPMNILPTRFGPFETADLRLGRDRKSRPCVGFRSNAETGGVLRIAGLACGTADRPVGREAVGCVIDRIDLVSAGTDEALKALFVEAERRRGSGCVPAAIVTPGLARITWLDATGGPLPLKGPTGDRQR